MRAALLQVVFLLFGAISLATCRTKCVPKPTKNFRWTDCASKVKGPIEIKSVEAYQDGKTVEQNGGLDLKKPLNMTFGIKNNYNKKEIADHKFDFIPYQYTDDEGPCDWYELDTQGTTNDIEGCQLIKEDCRYKKKLDKTVVVVDFPTLLGEFGAEASAVLEVGTYYAFDVTERDGKTTLSCVRLQALLKHA